MRLFHLQEDIKMKFYSELLKDFYESADECEKAEEKELARLEKEQKAHEKEASEKKARAAEVEEAYKALQDARKKYNELVTKFINDYKSFHFTFSNTKDFLDDVFETHFRFF